jgi:hypothetical protein
MVVTRSRVSPNFMRTVLIILGVLCLLDAGFRKRPYRLGLYEFEDDSDITLDRRTGRAFAALVGIALILWALLSKSLSFL